MPSEGRGRDIFVAFSRNRVTISRLLRLSPNVGWFEAASRGKWAGAARFEGWRMRRSAAILATMSAVGSVSAAGFVTALLAPEAPGTKALGTNGSSIVGEFTDNTGTHGFIDSGGNVIVLDVPGASSTEVLGIDRMGDVVGVFAEATGTTGFVGVGGALTMLAVPGASYTEPVGISSTGEIVGSFVDQTGMHGFVDVGGSLTPLNAPFCDRRDTSAQRQQHRTDRRRFCR